MQNPHDERMDFDGSGHPTDAPAGRDDGRHAGDGNPLDSRPSTRWVQLAYDLEQYGDLDPEERGEVF
jgi:hypothetical protein